MIWPARLGWLTYFPSLKEAQSQPGLAGLNPPAALQRAAGVAGQAWLAHTPHFAKGRMELARLDWLAPTRCPSRVFESTREEQQGEFSRLGWFTCSPSSADAHPPPACPPPPALRSWQPIPVGLQKLLHAWGWLPPSLEAPDRRERKVIGSFLTLFSCQFGEPPSYEIIWGEVVQISETSRDGFPLVLEVQTSLNQHGSAVSGLSRTELHIPKIRYTLDGS